MVPGLPLTVNWSLDRKPRSGRKPALDAAKGNKLVEDIQGQEMWTGGVDPAEVDILKDARGQPIVLGRGQHAVVYLGRWQATQVAVKVMLASDTADAQEEMQAQADILRRLTHPNIVLLMAVCISPGEKVEPQHPYICISIRPTIHRPVRRPSNNCSSIHTSVPPSIHPRSTQLIVLPFIHPSNHRSIHPFIHTFI
jgi:hypothetical protein